MLVSPLQEVPERNPLDFHVFQWQEEEKTVVF